MRAVISGTGMFVPEATIDNHALSRIMDTSDEWIRQRTGIVTRHLAAEGVATSDLAAEACRLALADAGLAASDVDYVICATMTPDHYFPGAAPLIQRKLGMRTTPALDIRQQCAGFIFGLQLADAVIRSRQHSTVLLVGSEVHSCLMPWRSWDVVFGRADREVSREEYDANTATRDRTVLFGDGAGACVLTASRDEDRGVLDVLLRTDGEFWDRLRTDAGGSAYRPYYSPEMSASGATVPVVEGREVFRLAVTLMPEVVLEILDRNGFTLEDVDLVVMHQANLRINEAVQKRLGLPDDKVFNNIQSYGNTTAATIPIAFHEAQRAGRVHDGDLVCFVGLGSGLNWGAVLYRC